jgi:hypothetical protein
LPIKLVYPESTIKDCIQNGYGATEAYNHPLLIR